MEHVSHRWTALLISRSWQLLPTLILSAILVFFLLFFSSTVYAVSRSALAEAKLKEVLYLCVATCVDSFFFSVFSQLCLPTIWAPLHSDHYGSFWFPSPWSSLTFKGFSLYKGPLVLTRTHPHMERIHAGLNIGTHIPVVCARISALYLNTLETFQVISHEFIHHRKHASSPLDRKEWQRPWKMHKCPLLQSLCERGGTKWW